MLHNIMSNVGSTARVFLGLVGVIVDLAALTLLSVFFFFYVGLSSLIFSAYIDYIAALFCVHANVSHLCSKALYQPMHYRTWHPTSLITRDYALGCSYLPYVTPYAILIWQGTTIRNSLRGLDKW